MNKNLYRVVFNAARGLRMAVQETAMSMGKATGATSGLVGTALASLLVSTAAHGQIVAAPNAPGSQRPTVLMAPNGVPLVNIQTPSAAGVSRNVYNRFDVQRNGVILNNSRTNVQTQLGGFVQGNPWLARGPARVILNEINSGNPTQLRGAIEVGGQRAEVVVANPAGIAVDGGTFLNASRATLTTGVPRFNAAGGLDSFVVREGSVSIEGLGLDVGSTDYAAILARAVQVNAGIWADRLKVVTGANEVSADHAQVTPVEGSGATPSFALDVAHLGGMYKGKILIVGTEAGLGVRNAGTIGGGVGEMVITANGRLENRGTIEAPRVELSGTDIDNRQGTIRQTGAGGLTITAPVLSNTGGGVIGAAPSAAGSAPAGGSGTGSGGTPDTSVAGTGSSTSSPASSGTAPSQAQAPLAPGSITATGSVLNDGGAIYPGGALTLQTPRINNAGGALSVDDLAVSGPSFSNAGGTLNVAGSFSARVGQFDNTFGTVRAGSMDVDSQGELINHGGTLASEGDATLTAGGVVDNARGSVTARGTLGITAAGAVTNDEGRVASGGYASVAAASLSNRGGTLSGAGTVDIRSGALANGAGLIQSGGALGLVTSAFDNTGGEVQGTTGLRIDTTGGALDNTAGTISNTSGSLRIDAGSLTNAARGTQSALIASGGELQVQATQLANTSDTKAQALLSSAGDMRLEADGSVANSRSVKPPRAPAFSRYSRISCCFSRRGLSSRALAEGST